MFSIPTLQLGDIVTLDYKNSDGLEWVATTSDNIVVYNIEYGKSLTRPTMTIE
jgi:hypothetical protein